MAYDSTTFEKPPAEVDEVGQIILKARDLLSDPAKWTNDASDCDRYCIVTALAEVSPATQYLPLCRIAAVLGFPGAVSSVWFFNDRPTTTHADVLALLDRAAKAQSGDA